MIKPTPKAVCDWLGTLQIIEGPLRGRPFHVLPYQHKFVKGFLGASEAALSEARGNGKTTFCAGLALSNFMGPMMVEGGETIVVASSLSQARVAFKHVVGFFKQIVPPSDYAPLSRTARFRLVNNTHQREIEDRETENVLRLLGSDPDRAHGLAPSLVLADEPAKWKRQQGDFMYSALKTALGKQDPSRLLVIGTQSNDETHWFSEMLHDPGVGVYSQLHAAKPEGSDFSMASIRAANPGYDYLPSLREALTREKKNAREKQGSHLAQWRSLRLNRGTSEIGEREMIIQIEDWKACEKKELPKRAGPVAIGLDVGGSASMTALAFYWPETGRLEAYGAFPVTPDLTKRGEGDAVGDRYSRMHERGELVIYPGRVTPVAAFIEDMASKIGGQDVIGIVSDGYKQAEVEQAMLGAGVTWKTDFRRVGSGMHGSADIREFQKEVIEGHIRTLESLLLRSAIRESYIARDSNGNPKLDKIRQLGRIDVMQAAVHAIAAGRRWRLPSLDGEESDLKRFYRDHPDALDIVVG